MAYVNLSLNFKRAQFVEKSKEPKDGFEKMIGLLEKKRVLITKNFTIV